MALLPLWRTFNMYVFQEDAADTRLVIIWDLDHRSPAYEAKVIFTVKGAETTFNPPLFLKKPPLTGVMTLHSSANSPGFVLTVLDTLCNWAHESLGDQALKVTAEYGKNVVRLRREARNKYGTVKAAIEAESAAGVIRASGAVVQDWW